MNGFCFKGLLLSSLELGMHFPIETTLYIIVKFSGQTVEIYLTFGKLNHKNNITDLSLRY